MEPETYEVSALGYEIAQDVWNRYSNTTETMEEIAADYDIDVATLRFLMTIVFHGGTVQLD